MLGELLELVLQRLLDVKVLNGAWLWLLKHDVVHHPLALLLPFEVADLRIFLLKREQRLGLDLLPW